MATDALELPFTKRLKLYLDERFPLTTHVVVLFAFFFSNYFLAQRLLQPGPAILDLRVPAGMLVVLLTFFLLRIFDEFKDYARDVVAHPERVVSRGIMPLSELRVMGWTVVAAIVLLNLSLGWAAFVAYVFVIGFALLMFKEFFVGDWLNRHVMVYALTHQVITPLLCVYVYVMAMGSSLGAWSHVFWLQLLMGAGTGLGWEIARKVRMPEDEHAEIETYSKAFGPRGAAFIAFGSLSVGAASAVSVGLLTGFPVYAYALLGLGWLVMAAGFVRFFAGPNSKRAKGLDNWAAVLMLLCYVAIALGAVADRGWQFTF